MDKKNFSKFNDTTIAEKFYDDFRCGLVHEGRIKNLGQVTYEIDSLVIFDPNKNIMMINPGKLLKELENIFKNYITILRNNNDEYIEFNSRMKKDFEKEVEHAKKL